MDSNRVLDALEAIAFDEDERTPERLKALHLLGQTVGLWNGEDGKVRDDAMRVEIVVVGDTPPEKEAGDVLQDIGN